MPSLHFNPSALSFGQIEIGHSVQTAIELRNDGTSAAVIDSIAVTGSAFTRGGYMRHEPRPGLEL